MHVCAVAWGLFQKWSGPGRLGGVCVGSALRLGCSGLGRRAASRVAGSVDLPGSFGAAAVRAGCAARLGGSRLTRFWIGADWQC